MKAPIHWLKDWVEITDTPDVLAERLLLSGTKVESIDQIGEDTVYDLEITSNRPDTLSLYGVAREIAAITQKPLKHLEFPLPEKKSEDKSIEIDVAQKDLMFAYSSVVIDGVQIKESPDWLKKRLEAIGIRSINTVVDITNYVMVEYGIPIHAFDYDKIEGATMRVRESTEGEKVTPLDGVSRTLKQGTIIIEDSKKLVDLAGIMGGKNSEITDSTKTVFLHVPIYNPLRIRQTSKYLGLRTEAVTRYEKKIDLTGAPFSMARAVNLIIELAGGRIASPIYTYNEQEYKSPQIEVTQEQIQKLIGIDIPVKKTQEILSSLEFSVTVEKESLKVTPPPFRRDVEIPEDVIEEIVRIYGYNNLPLTLPNGPIPVHPDAFEPDIVRMMKVAMIGLGFTEVYGFTLTSGQMLQDLGFKIDDVLKVLHPMSADFEYFRPSLTPGLLTMAKENLKYGNVPFIFEVGTVFPACPEQWDAIKQNTLPMQHMHIGALVPVQSFVEAKGYIDGVLRILGVREEYIKEYDPTRAPFLDKDQAVMIGSAGVAGRISQAYLKKVSVAHDSFFMFELCIDQLKELKNLVQPYPALPKYPPVIEDLTFSFGKEVLVGDIINTIKGTDKHIAQIKLISTYEDAKTFRIFFQHPDKTMTTEEVGAIRNKIVTEVEKKFHAKLKGNV